MNPQLEGQAKILQEKIREKDQAELAAELQKQLSIKFVDLLSVINSLNQSKYDFKRQEPDISWNEGSTKLYHFSNENAASVIFIPSLINRSYILDLSEKRSFMRYLHECGLDTYLVDWGEPEEHENNFSIDDYIAVRLDKIINHVVEKTNRPVILAGYCMGGLMAIASTLRNQSRVKGLALIATPWDFHSKNFARIALNDETVKTLETIIQSSEKISAHIIQSMFYYLHPESVKHKLDSVFSFIGNDSARTEEFMAVENWVNDGISMTKNVAKECFINWVHRNRIMKGQWKIDGNVVDPTKITIPTFIVTSRKDHIVPRDCMTPLIELIANKRVVTNNMGHIALVAGEKARQNVWCPLKEWMQAL